MKRHGLSGRTATVLVMLWLCGIMYGSDADSDGKAVDDYNFAAWLYNTGKYETAAEAYNEFLAAFPDHAKHVEARFGLAQSYFHLEAFQKAATQYERILREREDFPRRAEVLFQLGQSRVALEEFEQAEASFREVAEAHADHYLGDWAVARRAACLTSLGKPAEAEALLEPFLERYTSRRKDPEDVAATRQMLERLDGAGIQAGGAFLDLIERSAFTLALARFNQDHFDEAASSFERFLEQYPDSTLRSEARFRLAQSHYRQGAYEEAAKVYASVDPDRSAFAAASAFERGLALYKAGELEEAADVFAAMAKRYPSDARAPKAALYAGTFRYEDEQYEEAIDRLRPLVANDRPFADEAAYWVAMAQFRLGRLDAARTTFEKALENYPKSSLAGDMRLGLADVELGAGHLAAAAAAFQDYVKANPRAEQAPRALYSAAVALHRDDQFMRADELCDTFLDEYRSDALVPDVLFLSAENRFLAGKNEKAADRYEAFLARDDGEPERVARARLRMAWVHHDAQEYDAALRALAAIDHDVAPGTVRAESAYLAGLCHFQREAYPQAIEAFETYLEAEDPSRFGDDALLKVGIAWQRENAPKKAIDALRRLLDDYEASDLFGHARFLLAERYSEIDDYRKALKHYRAVAEREDAGSLAPHALFGLGVAAYDQERWKESAEAFERLAHAFPESELVPQALYRRGRALMKASQWTDAAAAFTTLLEVAPAHELARSAQVNVAACHQEMNAWTQAARAYEAATRNYDPEDDQARLYYELAWAHREAGRPEAAREAFRELVDDYPRDPLAADAYFHLAEAAYKAHTDKEAAERDPDDLDEARRLYEKVLGVSESHRLLDKALYRIGWCWWQRERYDKAAETFDRLIRECPESALLPDALFQSGLAHARQEEKEAAIERLETLVSTAGYDTFEYRPDALIALSDCRLAQGNPGAALETLAPYFAKHEDHYDMARAHLLKGKALYALERYDQALRSLDACTGLTRSAVAAEARFYIGQAYQSQSNFQDAVVAYLRVQALYPSAEEWCAGATFESAKCYEALDQPEEATAALRQVVERYPGTRWAKLAAERLN